MKLRLGLVGLGNAWETRHRPALRTLSDRFDVRAVCDPVAHLAELAAQDFRASAVDGFHVLAGREDVDAVVLLSTQWYGALPILAACDAGKAVYCGDAVELDPGDGQRIKERVEATGISFMAEFPLRHAPATLRLKELIATQLGKPRLLFCHRRQAANAPSGQRTSTQRELVEVVDWCRYVVGQEPTSVVGIAHAAGPGDADDYDMMSLDFGEWGQPGSGTVAQISCGRYMPAAWHEAVTFRPPAAMQVACERGIAFIDLPATVTWFDAAGRHMESLDNERPIGERLLLHFHRSITSLVRNTSSLDDMHRAQRVVLEAHHSYTEGRRVRFEF